MFEKIEIFDKRYSELNRKLYEPSVAADPEAYQKIMKEIKSIEEIVLTYRDYKAALQTEQESLEILEGGDSELRELLGDLYLPFLNARRDMQRNRLQARLPQMLSF